MREVIIGGTRVAEDTLAYVIAEIGHNHGGSLETCKRLFDAAAWAGASAVKLQKRDNRTLFTRAMYEAPYESEHSFGRTYGEHRGALEFDCSVMVELADYAHQLGLAFGVTPFDQVSAAGLAKLGRLDFFKIASGCLTDLSLIQEVAGYGLPVLVSTGGGTFVDVSRVAPHASVLLQCTATYPCAPAEMNLRVIERYCCWYPFVVVGLSDHQDGISLAPAAYALGARVFEKHFTLDHNARGSDHRFSLEPEGLRTMIKALRQTHEALGDGVKRRYESEEPALRKMAKSTVYARDLPRGHILDAADLAYKSPAGGLPPYRGAELVGRRLTRAVVKDDQVSEEVAVLWD